MHLPAGVRPAIVGRDREQGELAAALAGARAGHGQAVLVLGEAGMGKSMLGDWLASQAEQAGMQVAWGTCSAAGMPPLWPWRRSLAAIGLEWPWREDGATGGPVGRELMAAAIVEAVAAAAARQPLLIVLEDLHWSDPVSVLVARAAAEAAAALPLMLLLTCRDEQDEATQQVRDWLAELPASVSRMLLAPLDADAVAALASSVAGPGLAGRAAVGLQARTGGNPFFVQEVARLIAARGSAAALTVPPGVREVLQRRLARLSQPCMSLLTAAAIVAETAAEAIEDDLLCPVSGVSEEAAARLLDEAAAGRLLDVGPVGPARYRFRHALVREVLDHGLSAVRRGELHAAAGEALEQQASPPAAAARLAYHWSRAVGPQAREKAVAWSLRAARDAVAGFGFEAAVAHYARALAGRPAEAIAVSVEYGEALQMCGDVTAAREVLLGAAREAASAGRAGDLARAALALGGGLAGVLAAAGRVLPLLADAYRTGAGVPYAAYGPDGVSAQSALNRPAFVNSLVAEWLPQLPDVLARLQEQADPARVADLACGTGWAAIELAKEFPHIRVDGLDNDEASVAIGRQYAADHGVADRVDLEVVDLADESADWSPRYDLVLLIECVHDFPRPVEVLRNARAAVRPGDTVLVVDERAAETFTAPGDQTERFFAAASAIWCLPQGRVGPDPEPVGTLIRPAAMRDLARRAGYAGAEILSIEHPAWRFYRLVP